MRDPNSHHDRVPVSFATSDGLNLPSDNDSDIRKIQTQRQKERNIIEKRFCTDLYSSTQDEESHVSRLDDVFSVSDLQIPTKRIIIDNRKSYD